MKKGKKNAVETSDAKSFDSQIEKDIHSLKRSSRILAILGFTAFALLLLLVVYAIYDNRTTSTSSTYIDIAFVKVSEANLHETPNESARVIGSLKKDEPLLIFEKVDSWAKVQKKDISGWVHQDNLMSRSQYRARKQLNETPIQITEVDWIVDEKDTYSVVGKFKVSIDKPIHTVKINVNVFRKDGKLLTTEAALLASPEGFKFGQDYSFTVRGNYQKDFSYVTTQVVDWKE